MLLLCTQPGHTKGNVAGSLGVQVLHLRVCCMSHCKGASHGNGYRYWCVATACSPTAGPIQMDALEYLWYRACTGTVPCTVHSMQFNCTCRCCFTICPADTRDSASARTNAGTAVHCSLSDSIAVVNQRWHLQTVSSAGLPRTLEVVPGYID
jgi:hypothetical protein